MEYPYGYFPARHYGDGAQTPIQHVNVQYVAHQVVVNGGGGSGMYGGSGVGMQEILRKQTVRVVPRGNEDLSLTVRRGAVTLAAADCRDEHQHWIQHDPHSSSVNDEHGFAGFALINKATGLAIQHSLGKDGPLRLAPYDPDRLSLVWSQGEDLGDDFRAIRMVNDTHLNFSAFHGDDKYCGYVKEGTELVLGEWIGEDNQQWKIVPY